MRQLLASRSVWLLILLFLLAIFGPLLMSHDPVGLDSSKRLLPPSAQNWFGTDGFGMDIFTRILYGARTDLLLAFSAAGLAMGLGSIRGARSGYRGGWSDN